MAGHIRHVCFRRGINPARDSAIAPGPPHPQRKGRSAPGLTPGVADAHLDHRLGPALLPHAGCDITSARRAAAPGSSDRPAGRFRHQPWPGPGCEAGPFGRRLDRDRRTARQSAGEPKHRGLAMSYARRLGDAINPATLLFGRSESQPELVLQGSREDAANRWSDPQTHEMVLRVARPARRPRREHLEQRVFGIGRDL
jgi:hypothetical protein